MNSGKMQRLEGVNVLLILLGEVGQEAGGVVKADILDNKPKESQMGMRSKLDRGLTWCGKNWMNWV